MNLRPLERIAERWEEEGALFRQYGDERAARTCELHAEQLREGLREWWLEELTLQQAAEESGYSYDYLSELVRSGGVEDMGKKNSPRIRRCDLGRKVGHGAPVLRVEDTEPDLADEILAARGAAR